MSEDAELPRCFLCGQQPVITTLSDARAMRGWAFRCCHELEVPVGPSLSREQALSVWMSRNPVPKACFLDSTANRMHREGGTALEIVETLAQEKKQMQRRILELEVIAPKRYDLPDGRSVIWRCPDDLVPATKV